MLLKDERMKVMNEVLSGIKVSLSMQMLNCTTDAGIDVQIIKKQTFSFFKSFKEIFSIM